MKNSKRKLHILFIVLGVLASIMVSALMLTACDNSGLPIPRGLYVNDFSEDLTLYWNPVRGAINYNVEINGTLYETRRTSFNLEDSEPLAPGDYSFRIKAIGNGTTTKDSEWSQSVSYTKAEDSGLLYRPTDSYTAYEVAGIGRASGNVVVDDYYRGKPVVRIVDSAFAGSSSLTGIVIGNNVKTIGKNAFVRCSLLESVVIPEGVTSIGDSAFQRCLALTSITIPNSMKSIGAYCFSSCAVLKTVGLGTGVQTLGDYAFSSCAALEEIVVPNSVVSLGERSFYGCENLKNVTLSNSLTTISARSFDTCKSLITVTIPENVTLIDEGAFADCTKLASITVPNKVTKIGDSAFEGATALGNVVIGSAVESIGKDAFKNTYLSSHAKEIGDIFVYAGNWVVGCTQTEFADAQNFSISEQNLNVGKEVIGISDYAFSEIPGIFTVIIPESVKYIGKYAFYDNSIMELTIGDGVKVIGSHAFDMCTKLKTLVMGANVVDIQNHAFARCISLVNDVDLPDTLTHLGVYAFYATGWWRASSFIVYVDNWVAGIRFPKQYGFGDYEFSDNTVGICDYAFYNGEVYYNLVLNEGLKYIGKGAFYKCKNLVSINIPSTVDKVEDYAFYGCDALSSVTFAKGSRTKTLGRAAFYNCPVLAEISLPKSLTTIGNHAFYSCMALEKVDLGGAVTIGNSAFYGCESLKSVTVPDTTTLIGVHAFNSCTELESVKLGKKVQTISEYAFANCSKLKSIVIPGSVKDIKHHAFYRNTQLKSVEFNYGVETIGKYAFYGCTSLEDVGMTSSIVKIDDYAFKGDVKLKSVTISSDLADIGTHVFYGCNTLTIYSELDAAPEEWNEFWNSSFRPVIWSCTLDNGTVASFAGNQSSIENAIDITVIAPAYKNGYTLVGWSLVEAGDAAYEADELYIAADGKVLYAVWTLQQ